VESVNFSQQFCEHHSALKIPKVVQHEAAVSKVERIEFEWQFSNKPDESTTKNNKKNESRQAIQPLSEAKMNTPDMLCAFEIASKLMK